VAAVVSTYLAIRATRAEREATADRNRAVVAEAKAVQQRDRAEAAEREAKAAAETPTTEAAIARAVNEFLQQDLLGQADVDNQAGLGQKPDPDIKVRTLLDRAAAAVGSKFAEQPAVEAAIRRTIGDAYVALGLYPLAEVQLKRSFALARRASGEQDSDALNTMVSLAYLYVSQDKHAEAEPLLAEALQKLRRVHGDQHPETLRARCWLGSLFWAQGKWRHAELLLVKALESCRKALGDEHPIALTTMNELGIVYLAEGKFAEREGLYTAALEIARRVRGEDHATFRTVGNLSASCVRQGKHARADELSATALDGYRRKLGEDHPLTLMAMINRADVCNRMGKTAQAEQLMNKAIEVSRRIVREGYGDTFWAMCTLAETRQIQGRSAEAETLLRQAIQVYRRVLALSNAIELTTATNPLAQLYLEEGRPEKAEPLLIEAQTLGADLDDVGNPAIADTATAFARLRLKQHKPAEAESQAQRALAIRLDRRPDHWTRSDAVSLVGAALAGQKKYTDAEPLLIQGYEGLNEREERIPFVWRKKRPAEAGARILDLYEAWGKKDKADRWRRTLGDAKLQKGADSSQVRDQSK
jgi:hypothetical protein